jgi:hypothetical protein
MLINYYDLNLPSSDFFMFSIMCVAFNFFKRNVQFKKVFGDKYRILSCSNPFKFGKIPMYWALRVWLRV